MSTSRGKVSTSANEKQIPAVGDPGVFDESNSSSNTQKLLLAIVLIKCVKNFCLSTEVVVQRANACSGIFCDLCYRGCGVTVDCKKPASRCHEFVCDLRPRSDEITCLRVALGHIFSRHHTGSSLT